MLSSPPKSRKAVHSKEYFGTMLHGQYMSIGLKGVHAWEWWLFICLAIIIANYHCSPWCDIPLKGMNYNFGFFWTGTEATMPFWWAKDQIPSEDHWDIYGTVPSLGWDELHDLIPNIFKYWRSKTSHVTRLTFLKVWTSSWSKHTKHVKPPPSHLVSKETIEKVKWIVIVPQT